MGDGYSIHGFIEKWSRVCRGEEVEKPLLDRSALSPTSAPLVDNHPEYKVVVPTNPPPPTTGMFLGKKEGRKTAKGG